MPGIPPGRCGKVVVDADRHPGGSDGVKLFHELDRTRGPFPLHPIVVTKSGGEHHWFGQPATPVRYAKWGGGEVSGQALRLSGSMVNLLSVSDSKINCSLSVPFRSSNRPHGERFVKAGSASGHFAEFDQCPVYPRKADIELYDLNVRFVPQKRTSRLFRRHAIVG
jgi:hypothetical protein